MTIILDLDSHFLKQGRSIKEIDLNDCILDIPLIRSANLIIVLDKKENLLSILKARPCYPAHFFIYNNKNVMDMDRLSYIISHAD